MKTGAAMVSFGRPGSKANHNKLSAVIACDWFDTLARSSPGRTPGCVVYHRWKPDIALAKPCTYTRYYEKR
jgi:hypothetical protein